MLNLLIFLLTAWAATASGRTLLVWRRLDTGLTTLETNLIAFGLGLGLLAGGMLGLGLAGALYPVAGWGLLAALAVGGGRQHGRLMEGVYGIFRRGIGWAGAEWAMVLCFGAFALVSLAGCFVPPSLLEWDSLAYHLADPKLYLLAHRIYDIPWEDHSNFGFTAEMWYLWAMLVRGTDAGTALAKLFHFACGAGACLAIFAFGARHLTPTVGKVAALLFASTPFVFWEAGTAYVDLATVFYTALAGLVLASGIAARDEKLLRLSAVLMGLTLSTKATALGTLGLLGLGLLVWRLRGLRQPAVPALLAVAGWGAVALLVGSPWLIKSAVYTGNPVYPFFYGLLGGRGWSASAAAASAAWNASFGLGHGLADAVLAPWAMTMALLPGHPVPAPHGSFNDYQTEIQTLSPLLLAALFFPAFMLGGGPKAPPAVRALGAFALGAFLLWLATMHYARYLLPALPALCLLTAWALVSALAAKSRAGYALAGLGAASLLFSLYVGALLLAQVAPVALGLEPRAAYLARQFPSYPAMRYVNALPSGAKLVFYGNPLGFYCDRPYVWGEPAHGTFIPYDTFHSAEDLRRYFVSQGITHILVWGKYFPLTPPTPGASDYTAWVYALTAGSGPPLFYEHGVGVWAMPKAP